MEVYQTCQRYVMFELDPDGLSSSGFVTKSSFSIDKLAEMELPAMSENGALPIPTVDWDKARNKVYVVYPNRPTLTVADQFNWNIYVRVSTDAAATWSSPK